LYLKSKWETRARVWRQEERTKKKALHRKGRELKGPKKAMPFSVCKGSSLEVKKTENPSQRILRVNWCNGTGRKGKNSEGKRIWRGGQGLGSDPHKM